MSFKKSLSRLVVLFCTIAVVFCCVPLLAEVGAAPHGHVAESAAHAGADHGASTAVHHAPHLDGQNLSLLWAIPFVGILLSIALFPLLLPRFWHHHYGKVSLFWGLSFLIAFSVNFGLNMSVFYTVEVFLLEYFPFIMLLLALFTVSGGIRLKGDLAGTPVVNTVIILLGTVLASWMGTTGAAMLLIRPLLRANAWRRHKVHVVVFFIFLVANIGGSLTPLGDPPLFLGFLKGVSFFWTTTHVFAEMLTASIILLVLFFALDTYYYGKEENVPVASGTKEKLSLEGKANLILIPCVVVSVLVSSLDFGNAFTLHHVTMKTASLLQIVLLLAITIVSMVITKKEVRKGNEFTWEPIIEVAKLFATIFITMVPPIAMLKAGVAGPLGVIISKVVDPSGNFINANFFWATGMLSSFLDNAPTYVVFFETAGGNAASLMTQYADTLIAISCGAVFMGANTYIGNAPNFMVKSIAEESGVNMPSFFGYMLKYSIPILIPVFIIITLIFF
ncbi:MAG TPA: sodium:proton antiporter [Spirochaetota bacterium]|nr:sodium:proton antiporter [Spirochaetota bacterium]